MGNKICFNAAIFMMPCEENNQAASEEEERVIQQDQALSIRSLQIQIDSNRKSDNRNQLV
jgi:hypothetical protein